MKNDYFFFPSAGICDFELSYNWKVYCLINLFIEKYCQVISKHNVCTKSAKAIKNKCNRFFINVMMLCFLWWFFLESLPYLFIHPRTNVLIYFWSLVACSKCIIGIVWGTGWDPVSASVWYALTCSPNKVRRHAILTIADLQSLRDWNSILGGILGHTRHLFCPITPRLSLRESRPVFAKHSNEEGSNQGRADSGRGTITTSLKKL